jgi:hypothetical protein
LKFLLVFFNSLSIPVCFSDAVAMAMATTTTTATATAMAMASSSSPLHQSSLADLAQAWSSFCTFLSDLPTLRRPVDTTPLLKSLQLLLPHGLRSTLLDYFLNSMEVNPRLALSSLACGTHSCHTLSLILSLCVRFLCCHFSSILRISCCLIASVSGPVLCGKHAILSFSSGFKSLFYIQSDIC